jgi:hypothetical protein
MAKLLNNWAAEFAADGCEFSAVLEDDDFRLSALSDGDCAIALLTAKVKIIVNKTSGETFLQTHDCICFGSEKVELKVPGRVRV